MEVYDGKVLLTPAEADEITWMLAVVQAAGREGERTMAATYRGQLTQCTHEIQRARRVAAKVRESKRRVRVSATRQLAEATRRANV